ncbi:MAG: hypothetical protein ABR543_01655 [Gemmatimonadaceae bacterium]
MTMTCGQTRRALWPDAGPRSATAPILEAQEHASGCAACQSFFAEMRAVADGLREAAPRPVAPMDVRNRLFKALARARTGEAFRPRRLPWPASLWTAAAILVLALGVRVFWTSAEPAVPDEFLSALAEDHARAVSGRGITSSDPHDVSRWLTRHLPFAVHIPVFDVAVIRGARIGLIHGRRGAVVEYELGEKTVSYFVVPAGNASTRTDGPPVLRHAAGDGYGIVFWREAGLIHALVGSVPDSSLERLAKECIEQMRLALALVVNNSNRRNS